MKKLQKPVISCLLALLLTVSPLTYGVNSVYAAEYDSTELIYETDVETTDADIEQLKNLFNKVDSYIGLDGSKLFDEELAKANMRVLFDLQIQSNDNVRPQDAGMIIDAIFFNKDTYRGGDGGNWNERNSKPPLSAWAVWCIYEEHKDKAFVEEMYDKIKFYHEWWYRNRDYNKNGVAEYGATVHPLNNNEDEKILEILKNRKSIIILNKIDLNQVGVEKEIFEKYSKNIVTLSTKTQEGMPELLEMMQKMVVTEEIKTDNELLVINSRHKALISKAIVSLNKAIDTLNAGMPVDVIAIYIKEILEELGKITGESVTDDIISEIFSKFCLGK